jgi:hypothetical protein
VLHPVGVDTYAEKKKKKLEIGNTICQVLPVEETIAA